MTKRVLTAAIVVAGVVVISVLIKYIYYEARGEKEATEESPAGDTVKTYHLSKINAEWVKNGACEFTDSKGNLLRSGKYRFGKREGKWLFYEGGKVRVSAQYANDQRNGSYEIFYDDGRPKVYGRCLNGKEEGVWTVLFPGGNVLSLTTYIDGLKQGQYQEYFENKSLSISGYFRDDKYDSVWSVMNPLGYVAERRTYNYNELLRFESLRQNGTPIHLVSYDHDGKIVAERYLDEYGKDMIEKFFGTYRDLSAKCDISMDKLVMRGHGELTIYPPDRYILKQYNYTKREKIIAEVTNNVRGGVEVTQDSIILHPEERRKYPSRSFIPAIENRYWVDDSEKEWVKCEQWNAETTRYSFEEFRDNFRSGPVVHDEKARLPSKNSLDALMKKVPVK